ncbi:DUF6888 family protein [uncultured Nostoc sp.]
MNYLCKKSILPTTEQALACVRVCQMLSNLNWGNGDILY